MFPGYEKEGDVLKIINPGHGGKDPGSIKAGFEEKDITLVISWLLGGILTHAGQNVDIQRETDTDLPLQTIGQMAKAAGGDMFISIHTDSNINTTAKGCTVYYFPGDSRSKIIAENVVNDLAGYMGLANRGAREANFQVLRDTYKFMPAILVECAFISNDADREKLVSLTGCWRIANYIAHGILRSI